jgi:hypothetical protein
MNGAGLFGGIVITLFGIMNCFFGYRWFRVLLGIWGFFLGGALGMSLVAQAAPLVILIVGIVSAILGAIAILVLFRVAVFLVGAVLGYSLTLALLTNLRVPGNVLLWALLGAVIFGALALWLNQYFIILVTAFSGASAILTGVTLILTGEQAILAFRQREAIQTAFDNPPALVGVFWLLLALAGIAIQYRGLQNER